MWNRLHTALNTINWTVLDAWVASAKAAGAVRGTYCLYGTPQFLATKGTVGTTGTNVLDPYGGAVGAAAQAFGGASFPSDLSQLTYFCQQFAARNSSTWGGFFDLVSAGNEPFISASTTPDTQKFWWGTAAQFVDFLWTVKAALAGSGLKVASPGTFDLSSITVGDFSGIGTWLNTLGTVNSTKRGYDCFDHIAAHPYHAVPNGSAFSGWGGIDSVQTGGTLPFRAVLAGLPAASGEYHATEYAYDSAPGTADLTQWLARPASYRESFVQCLWIDAMLAGVKSMHAFSLGNTANLMGNLSTDDPGSISGLRKVYNACVGKTIVAPSGITPTGGRFLTFSDGSTYTVAAP
jgi:hypothetical protein